MAPSPRQPTTIIVSPLGKINKYCGRVAVINWCSTSIPLRSLRCVLGDLRASRSISWPFCSMPLRQLGRHGYLGPHSHHRQRDHMDKRQRKTPQ